MGITKQGIEGEQKLFKYLRSRGILFFQADAIGLDKDNYVVYEVKNSFLCTYNNFNSLIFTVLDIDKYELTEKAYGYNLEIGSWPVSEQDDYPALTRLVKELYTIIEKIEEKEIKYTKYNRFEIMDI